MSEISKEELNKGFIEIKNNRLVVEIDLLRNNNVMIMAYLEAAKGEYIKHVTKAMNDKRVSDIIKASIQKTNIKK